MSGDGSIGDVDVVEGVGEGMEAEVEVGVLWGWLMAQLMKGC